MDNNDIQELIYRIQGRSENFDALKDPVLHKEWTTGDHSVIVSSFNTFLDSLTAANASTGMTNKIPHFLLHANVDGAHIMVFNTVSSYGNGDWTQIAFGVQLSGNSIIAGSQILYRTHHGNSWSDWSNYVNADEEDITLTEQGLLKLRNKIYNGASSNGQGRIYIRSNDDLASLLSTNTNTRFIIQYEHAINSLVCIGANNTLVFEGGKITGGGILTGDKTVIEASPVTIFGTDITLNGTWKAADYFCEWFGGHIQKTLNTFHAIKFVGNYEISSQIWINDLCKIEFGTNSVITVSDSFNFDYLIGVRINKTDITYHPQKYDALRLSGDGLIDLSQKCGFIEILRGPEHTINAGTDNEVTNYFHYNSYFENLRVIRARKISNPERLIQAIVYNEMQEAHFTNCWFSSDNECDIALKHDYGIYCNAADCKFDRVTVINPNTAFYLGGSSMLSQVHAWGWPKVAFEVAGHNCFFSEVYADSAIEAFRFHADIHDVKICSFGAIPIEVNPNIQGRDYSDAYLIVTEGQTPLTGFAIGCIDTSIGNSYGTIHYPVHRVSQNVYTPLICPKLLFINTSEGYLPHAFPTSGRPASDIPEGYCYFDTTLHKPLWWHNNAWYDSSGTIVSGN